MRRAFNEKETKKVVPMKRRRIRNCVIKAATVCAVVIGVVSAAPAPAQENSPVAEPDISDGLVVTDSPWTTVNPDGTLDSIEGVVPSPSQAPAAEQPSPVPAPTVEQPGPLAPMVTEALDPLTTMGTMLVEPQVVGEVSFEYVGPDPVGTQVYQLEADVIFPQTPEGEVVGEPNISFVREKSAVPLVDVTDPAVGGTPVPETAVEVFAYPEPVSETELPADIPEDVTGDLITFDTQAAELANVTTFSTEVHLESVETDPANWSLYSGDATASELNAGVATYNMSMMLASSYGPVPPNHTRVVVQVGGDRLLGAATNNATRTVGRVNNVYQYGGEPGAVLQLYAPLNDNAFGNTEASERLRSNDNPVAINQPWATCTSDFNGECVFDIPVTGPGTQKYYWVAMTTASPGFEVQRVIRTGGSGNSGTPAGVDLRYAYATPYMQVGQTFYSGVQYKRNLSSTRIDGQWGSDWEASDGVISSSFMNEAPSQNNSALFGLTGRRQDRSALGLFQQVRSNPPLSNRCGLNVGFIVDTSGSMGDQGIDTIKAILNGGRVGGRITGTQLPGVLPSLANTGTRVGLVSFDDISPGSRNPANILTPLSLANSTQYTAARNWVGGLRSDNGGTNWEAGLQQFVNYNNTQLSTGNTGNAYDVVFMITDGNPTRLVTKMQPDNGVMGEFRHVEAAMGMANTLKSQGTRVIPVGIPADWPGLFAPNADVQLSVSEPNLQSLSGQSTGGGATTLRQQNFATFTNAEVFQQALINTLNECFITVERRLYEGDDPTAIPTPYNTRPTQQESASWNFNGTLVPTTGTTTTQSAQPVANTDSDNLVARINLNGTTGYNSVTVREPATGVPATWTRMDAAGGYNAQCTDSAGNPVNVTDIAPSDPNKPTNDFQLTNVPVSGGIHCIVYYRLAPSTFDLRLHKVDAQDRTIGLDGAAFELVKLGGTAGQDVIVPPTAQPTTDGIFAWDELEPGRYKLTETHAAAGGYSLLPQPVYFRVANENGQLALFMLNGPADQTGTRASASNQILTFPVVGFEATNNQVTMRVANVRVGDMPDTGGIGVIPWLVAGLVIGALGAAYAANGRRRAV